VGAWPKWLIELGCSLYLLMIPFGADLPGFLRNLPLLLLGAGLVGSARTRNAEGEEPFRYEMVVPFGIFVGSTLLSTVLSSDPAASVERSAHTPIAMLFFFGGQHIAADLRALRRFQLTICGMLLLFGIDGVWQSVSGASLLSGSTDHLLHRGRVTGSLPHPNDLALIPILAPFGVSVLVRERLTGVRLAALVSLALAITTAFLTQSRNCWLGFAVGMGTLLLLAGSWKLTLRVSAAAVLAFGAAAALDFANLRARLTSLAVPQAEGRFHLWSAAWRMFLEAPVVGKGIHVFGEFYAYYLSELGLADSYVREKRPIPWAHNLYLELLAERGITGFAAWALVVGQAGRRAFRFARIRPMGSESAALFASIATFLAMGLLDLTFYKDWVTLVFWLLMGLAAQTRIDGGGSSPSVKP
jgi:O-antigen ligase